MTDRATSAYYFAWQGCSLAFALVMGGWMYLVLHLVGTPDLMTGLWTGAVIGSLWERTKWKGDDQ